MMESGILQISIARGASELHKSLYFGYLNLDCVGSYSTMSVDNTIYCINFINVVVFNIVFVLVFV